MAVAATTLAPKGRTYPAGVQFPTQELTADGAITIPCGFVVLNKAGVLAATLAAPTYDGQWLVIVSETANAHTLDLATSGVNGGSADVGTFGGAVGDGVSLFSLGGHWYSFGGTNVTFA
jgi:hypothetical protein